MFVLVFLSVSRRYTVVDESFIFQLIERNVKNFGINRNQNRLIYFLREWFERRERNETIYGDFVPNFTLETTNEYPLPDGMDETCFIGRMICFEGNKELNILFIFSTYSIYSITTDSFESAMMHAERLRERLPAVYNPARVQEKPIPPIVAEENEQVTDNDSAANSESEEQVDDENMQQTDFELPEQSFVEQEENVKENIVVEEEDLIAFDDLFNGEPSDTHSGSNEFDPIANEQIEDGSNHSVSAELSEAMFTSIQFESTPIDANSSANVVSDGNTEQVDAPNPNDSTFFDESTTVGSSNVDNESQMSEQVRLAQIDANVQELLVRGENVCTS